MFINYNPTSPAGTISVRSYRDPQAVEGDLGDIVIALSTDSDEVLTATLDDSALTLLESADHWCGSDATSDALETIHSAVSNALN